MKPSSTPRVSFFSFFLFVFFLSSHPHPPPSAHYIDSRQGPAPPHVSCFFFLSSLHSFASTIRSQHHHRSVHPRRATSARNVSATHLTHLHGKYNFIGYKLLLTLFFWSLCIRPSTRLHANASASPHGYSPTVHANTSACQRVPTDTQCSPLTLQQPAPPPPLTLDNISSIFMLLL